MSGPRVAEPILAESQRAAAFDAAALKSIVERWIAVADYTIGGALMAGALAFGLRWHVRFDGFLGLRTFYILYAWAVGVLELLTATGMRNRWRARWILQLLPLAVPVVAYQYFILHFIYHRL